MLRAVLIAAGLVLGADTALAADPPVPSLPARSAAVADAILSRSVRAAIDADPELRGVNLIVSIVDGVAVVAGPVSSPTVAKRVEFVVRKVPDIKDVKNGCYVSAGPDPFLAALNEKMGSTAPARPDMADLPGVVVRPQPPSPPIPVLPSGPNPSQIAMGPTTNTVVARKVPSPAGGGLGVLGAPVGPVGSGTAPVSSREPGSAPPTPGRLTASNNPAQSATNDILISANNVRKVEARFANLTVEMREGILLVGGTSPRASDAWDLAEKLRQIPGVSRVVVGTMPGK